MLVFTLLVAVLVTSGCSLGPADAPSQGSEATASLAGQLVILHTNDIHGRALPDSSTGALGYAAIAQVKNELQEQGASVLLLDAGDASQGTALVNMGQGQAAFEFMNISGYDAMAPGNHELDWGLNRLLQSSEIAQFPVLCANIVQKTGNDLVFEPNKIFALPNGMKVGVFGLNTPELLTKTHPDKHQGIDVLQGEALYAAAQAQIDELDAAGCDLIVALGHLGTSAESAPNRSLDVIENTEGIDLFVDGHSHTVLTQGQSVNDSLLVSAGEYGQYLGMVSFDGSTLTASLYTGLDPTVSAYISEVNAGVMEELSTVFATAEVDLDGNRAPGVRTQETNLGDFAADAILYAARQSYSSEVVAAITNGGSIRASIPRGDVTMNDMKTVFPFDNQVGILTVTGAELLEALEAATCSVPEEIGAFPQVAGIIFTLDTSVPYANGEQYPDSTYFAPAQPGSRVTIESVGGQPFAPDALYLIATNDFVAAGGDTYYALRHAYQNSGFSTGVALEDALVNYTAQELSGVIGASYAQPQGRITIR